MASRNILSWRKFNIGSAFVITFASLFLFSRNFYSNWAPLKEPGRNLTSEKENSSWVRIALCADRPQFEGIVGVIASALASSNAPDNLFFYVVTEPKSQQILLNIFKCYGISLVNSRNETRIQPIAFNTEIMRGKIRVWDNIEKVGNLASPLNYARFFLHQLVDQSVDKLIYLDVDLIIKGDLQELWADSLQQQEFVAYAPRNQFNSEVYFSVANISRISQVYFNYYGVVMDSKRNTFNAGVMVLNLKRWRSENVLEEVYYWLEYVNKKYLWNFGTQPIMLMITNRRDCGMLSGEWNYTDLGWKRYLSTPGFDQAKIIHWNGSKKPWLQNSNHKDAWSAYMPPMCGNVPDRECTDASNYVCEDIER